MAGIMSDPLQNPKLKIQRAESHIGDAKTLISAFLATDPFRKEWEIDKAGAEKNLFIKATDQPPNQLAAIIGDATHNLRTALDHLACCLAVLNGATNLSNVHFPFYKKGDKSSEAGAQKHIKRLSPEAQVMIHDQKPYAGGNDVLYSIHQLDLIDKHTTIITAIAAGFVSATNFSYDQPIRLNTSPKGRLDKGILLLSVPEIANGECDTTYIAFADIKILEGESVVTTLDDFLCLVKDIIAIFERRFF